MSDRDRASRPGGGALFGFALVAREGEPAPRAQAAVRDEGAAPASALARGPLPPRPRRETPVVDRARPRDEMLDRVHDAIVTFDRAWRVQFMNRSAEEYLGPLAPRALGRVLWEAFPTLCGTEVEARYRSAVATQTAAEFELESPVTGRWVEVRAFPSERGLTVILRDMTERQRSERALRAGEARYRAMFEHTQASVLLASGAGLVLAANPAACRALGREGAAVVGARLTDLLDDGEGRLDALLSTCAREGAGSAEWAVRRGDGSTFVATVIASRYRDDEGVDCAMISLLDVTTRRRGEAAMAFLAEASAALGRSLDPRETVASLARLVVPARADLCVVDLVERDRLRRVEVVVADPALEPVAEALRGVMPGQEAREGIRKVLRTGEPLLAPRIDEGWLVEATGDRAYLEVVRSIGARSLLLVPLATAGRRIGVLTLARVRPGADYDAHDLSIAERLADHAALAIENGRIHRAQCEALRQRDEVLGVVSHDLRNPLHAIALNARVVSRRSQGAEQAVADLETAIGRASRLVEDLLAAACADAHALRLTRSYEHLAAIFSETLSLHRTIGEERSVRLAATIDPGVPEAVFVDHHRLLQCLGNLVGNALKFTPPGGAVTLGATVRDAELVITVSDTGPGIAADEVPHLFERFWQGASRQRGDAGLGLSIVKAVAEAHGGSVGVRTALGAGTTFALTLPLTEPQDGGAHSIPPPVAASP